ncbi:MAG: helix-turn-helix domain-containing protein [Phycisphaerae bacterium]
MPDLITLSEAARLLGITRQAVHYLVEHGRLPVVTRRRVTRLVRREDVERYREARK